MVFVSGEYELHNSILVYTVLSDFLFFLKWLGFKWWLLFDYYYMFIVGLYFTSALADSILLSG